MLSRRAMRRMASPSRLATETTWTFAGSSVGWVSTLSVMNEPDNINRRARAVADDLMDASPAYVLTAILPAGLLLMSAWRTQQTPAAGFQTRLQIVFLTIIAALAGVGWNVLIFVTEKHRYQNSRPKGYEFLMTDSLIVAVPLVWLLISAWRARLSKTFLFSLPVVIVTSRGEKEDRRRGAEAGADAYVVKGEFDQQALLDTVRRLAVLR